MNISFMKGPVYLQPSFSWRLEWTKITQKNSNQGDRKEIIQGNSIAFCIAKEI